MPEIRLIAIDVDGTLLERGSSLTVGVKGAVRRATAAGIAVTVASGRPFPQLVELARELDLRVPVICFGGALVVDPSTGKTLRRRGVPLPLAREVIKLARELGRPARAYDETRVYVDEIRPGAFNHESLIRANALAVGDLLSYLKKAPVHLAIDAPSDETRALVVAMRARFDPRLRVTTGHPLLTEFSRPEVHKGSALRWLARSLGIPRSATMAIGDDWNDLEMLAEAGLSVAMADGQPEALAAARVVVPGAAEDGVAIAIEQLVLGQRNVGGPRVEAQ